MALEMNNSNFAETLTNNSVTLVDFWAPWCGPCKMLGPVIDQLADENNDVTIGKVNVDDNTDLAVQYGIRGIPTILFFKDGQMVDKIVGIKSKADLQEKINALKA
jgi:thioredoxin 1